LDVLVIRPSWIVRIFCHNALIRPFAFCTPAGPITSPIDPEFRNDGKILGLKVETLGNVGVYLSNMARSSGQQIEIPSPLSARGKPLQFEDIEIVPGTGAVPFNRERFGGRLARDTSIKPKRTLGVLRKSTSRKKR
jgi:hypothetical protein